jgi:hypothetical protein
MVLVLAGWLLYYIKAARRERENWVVNRNQSTRPQQGWVRLRRGKLDLIKS